MAKPLAINPGSAVSTDRVRYTPTALVIDKNLSYDEWEELGSTLQGIGKAWQWWVGDWLNYGETRWGEKYAQALDAGLEYQAAANAAWVAKAVQVSTRVETLSWTHHRVVAKLDPPEQKAWLAKARENAWSSTELANALSLRVHHSSESAEWNTPAHVVAAVNEVLGTIDLDPCSDSIEHPNVPAGRVFTFDDDGLSQPWSGKVYMNPPYGDVIGEWVNHLVAEFEAGRTTEALALVPARTDTEWWRAINAYPWCGIYGRLRFGEAESGAPFPSAMFYLGKNLRRFVKVFGEFGAIYERR